MGKEAIRKKSIDLVERYRTMLFSGQPSIQRVKSIPPSGKVLGAAELKNIGYASLDGGLRAGQFTEKSEKGSASLSGFLAR